jgi:hypothetical protein
MPDRGLQVLLPAVDGNDARAALGQKAHGGGADDPGSPGDDGNPAIEANSIGHVWHFPWAGPVVPDFWWFGAGARTLIGCDYSICRKG